MTLLQSIKKEFAEKPLQTSGAVAGLFLMIVLFARIVQLESRVVRLEAAAASEKTE